jgi:hypothetical protein
MKYLFVFSLILISCQMELIDVELPIDMGKEIASTENTKDSLISERIQSPTHERLALEAYLFCELDDAESDEADTSKIYPWLREKANAIYSGTESGELFGDGPSSRGGGPNGAHSVPSTDLYLAIEFAKDTKDSEIRVFVNGKKVTSKIKVDADLYWMKFPMEDWRGRLRTIQPKDTRELFPTGYEGVAPLTTGKILKVEIYTSEKKITKYLHCWFPTC